MSARATLLRAAELAGEDLDILPAPPVRAGQASRRAAVELAPAPGVRVLNVRRSLAAIPRAAGGIP